MTYPLTTMPEFLEALLDEVPPSSCPVVACEPAEAGVVLWRFGNKWFRVRIDAKNPRLPSAADIREKTLSTLNVTSTAEALQLMWYVESLWKDILAEYRTVIKAAASSKK